MNYNDTWSVILSGIFNLGVITLANTASLELIVGKVSLCSISSHQHLATNPCQASEQLGGKCGRTPD
jgi:hypothetical protein